MKKKHWNTAVRAVLVVALCLLLLLNLWQLFARAVFGARFPMVFGYAPIIVLSGSMEPTFSANDIVVIHAQDNYSVGDVVTFDDGGTLVTHRIVSQSQDGFVTQGDANNTTDGVVATDQIEGSVTLVIPMLGGFLLFLRTPFGMVLLLALGLLLLFLPGKPKEA